MAAKTATEMIVQLSVDMNRIETSMNRAAKKADQAFTAIEHRGKSLERRLHKMGYNVGRTFNTMTRAILPFTGALGVREIQRYADSWTEAGNKMRAATAASGIQSRSLNQLKDDANGARAGLGEYVQLYARLLRATAGVAKDEKEVALATDIVSKAFKAGGAAASEQAAGIMQLGQALGSGLLAGDELRSIRENAPLLAQAIAKEFDTTIAGLKKLGSEGKLTSEKVFRGIINAQKDFEHIFAQTKATIGDAMTQINNEFTAYIGNADQSVGASEDLVAALQYAADNFKDIADDVVIFIEIMISAFAGHAVVLTVAGLTRITIALGVFLTAVEAGTVSLAILTRALGPIGLLAGAAAAAIYLYQKSNDDASWSVDEHTKAVKALKDVLPDLEGATVDVIAQTKAKARADVKAAEAAFEHAKAVALLALAEHESQMGGIVNPDTGERVGGEDSIHDLRRSNRLKQARADLKEVSTALSELRKLEGQISEIEAGSTKTKPPTKPGDDKKTKQSEFERMIEQIKKRTAALDAETAARANLNPLVDDYGYVVEKARAKHELLTAARKAGLAIDGDVARGIETTAEAFAQASISAGKLAEQQDRVRQSAADMRALGEDVMGGFIKDLRGGKSAAESLEGAIGKIADKLIDMAIENLFANAFSGGGGSFPAGGNSGGLFGGAIIPSILHNGGVAGSDGYGTGRSFSANTWSGAPRYHNGGIAGLRPNEVPAILERGEVITPANSNGNSRAAAICM